MRIFCTKWVLTEGIIEVEGRMDDGRVFVPASGLAKYSYWLRKEFCHETMEAARNHAEHMRGNAIAACHRKISRLLCLKFNTSKKAGS